MLGAEVWLSEATAPPRTTICLRTPKEYNNHTNNDPYITLIRKSLFCVLGGFLLATSRELRSNPKP